MSARDRQILERRNVEAEEQLFYIGQNITDAYQNNMQTQRNILQKDDADFSSIEFAPQSGNEANDNQQKIDFDQQLQAYKERTEMTLPYVATQVEDAMYLNQQHVVTLEYHYFQNDCIYSPLEKVDEKDISDHLPEKEKDIFGTKNFGKSGQSPSSQFHANEDDDETDADGYKVFYKESDAGMVHQLIYSNEAEAKEKYAALVDKKAKILFHQGAVLPNVRSNDAVKVY